MHKNYVFEYSIFQYLIFDNEFLFVIKYFTKHAISILIIESGYKMLLHFNKGI
jgi:hypothetical protein